MRHILVISFLESSFMKSLEEENSFRRRVQYSSFLRSWHCNSTVENLKELPPFSNYKYLITNWRLSNWIWNSIEFPQVTNYKYLISNRRLSNWKRMPDRTPSDAQSAIRNVPIQRNHSSHHMVLSGQAWGSFLSGPFPPKSSPKRPSFLFPASTSKTVLFPVTSQIHFLQWRRKMSRQHKPPSFKKIISTLLMDN